MRFENVAPTEVANQHLSGLKNLFNSSGEGVVFWNKLEEDARIALCIFAGLNSQRANDAINRFSPEELHRLRKGTKRLEQLAVRFNHISVLDFK